MSQVETISLASCLELGRIFQGSPVGHDDAEAGQPQRIVMPGQLSRIVLEGEPSLGQVRLRHDYQLLATDDVLVAHRGAFRVALVTEAYSGCVAHQGLAVLRPDKNRIDPQYLVTLLLSARMRSTIEGLYMGSREVQMIRLAQLETILIPLPALHEQRLLGQARFDLERWRQSMESELSARMNLLEAALASVTGGDQAASAAAEMIGGTYDH